MKYHKFIVVFVILLITSLTSCNSKVDQRKMKHNVKDRVKQNIDEGRGIRFGSIIDKPGTFNFNTSNPLWRASIESLDFMPLSSADYGGGIIITDWYSSGKNENEEIKITIRFISNEIRADAIQIYLHKKLCKPNMACKISQIESEIKNSLKLKILKKAALIQKQQHLDSFEKTGSKKIIK